MSCSLSYIPEPATKNPEIVIRPLQKRCLLMPDPSFIMQEWEMQERVFSDNLARLKKAVTIDEVHDLRVAVKKLRSYKKLCCGILDQETEKEDGDTRALFNVLGTYRDLQVNIQLLDKMQEKSAGAGKLVKRMLQFMLPEATRRARAALKKYPAGKGPVSPDPFRNELLSLTTAETIDKIHQLFRNHAKGIREKLKDMPGQAHPLRKELKDVFYWLSICPPNSVISSSRLKNLDKIQGLLGDWQDNRVLRQKLRYYRKEFLPGGSDEYDLYVRSERNLKEENKARLDAILKKTKKWLGDL